MAAVMYHARTVVFATENKQDQLTRELQTLSDDIKPEWYENWYDGLGYCEYCTNWPLKFHRSNLSI